MREPRSFAGPPPPQGNPGQNDWEPAPLELPVGPAGWNDRRRPVDPGHEVGHDGDEDEESTRRDRPDGSHVIIIDLA